MLFAGITPAYARDVFGDLIGKGVGYALPATKVAQNMLRKTATIHHPNPNVRAKKGEQL